MLLGRKRKKHQCQFKYCLKEAFRKCLKPQTAQSSPIHILKNKNCTLKTCHLLLMFHHEEFTFEFEVASSPSPVQILWHSHLPPPNGASKRSLWKCLKNQATLSYTVSYSADQELYSILHALGHTLDRYFIEKDVPISST